MPIFVNFHNKFHLPVGWCCKVKIASVSRTPPMIRLTPKYVWNTLFECKIIDMRVLFCRELESVIRINIL